MAVGFIRFCLLILPLRCPATAYLPDNRIRLCKAERCGLLHIPDSGPWFFPWMDKGVIF